MEKVLFAADELTGLIGAAALMRPSKSVQDMKLSSIRKKYKDKKFAAGCSRDVISQGAQNLGWELNELFEKTILAMRSCEDSIKQEMQKYEQEAVIIMCINKKRKADVSLHAGPRNFLWNKRSAGCME